MEEADLSGIFSRVRRLCSPLWPSSRDFSSGSHRVIGSASVFSPGIFLENPRGIENGKLPFDPPLKRVLRVEKGEEVMMHFGITVLSALDIGISISTSLDDLASEEVTVVPNETVIIVETTMEDDTISGLIFLLGCSVHCGVGGTTPVF